MVYLKELIDLLRIYFLTVLFRLILAPIYSLVNDWFLVLLPLLNNGLFASGDLNFLLNKNTSVLSAEHDQPAR